MTRKIRHRNVCIAIGLVLLLFALFFFSPAMVQESAAVHTNPYVVRTFVDEEGQEIAEIVVPERPPEIKAEAVMVPEPNIAMGINTLLEVPAFDWCYGCSATAAAMMFGYYDRTGYTNMYAGPTNGGVCPLTNSVWGSGECPLSATHRYYDELAVKGHVDDYWYSFTSTVDPYYGNWPEHGYADCTADFMGTNQYKNWRNKDGATIFYYYMNGAPLYDYSACEGQSPPKRDGTHGMRLFVESRGYNVYHDGLHYQNYFQLIYGYNGNTQGFTFNQYKAEIDSGRPVIIQVLGHSMLGYGYNDPDTVYLHDTWDHSDHEMTWGGSYSGMQHYGVTVIQLKALPPPEPPEIISCDSGGAAQTFFQPGESVYVQGSNFQPSTYYKIWIQDSPVSEGDPLVQGEDDSGSQEPVTTDGTGSFGQTEIWAIPMEPLGPKDYDVIVDKQGDGTGYYNAASDGKASIFIPLDVTPPLVTDPFSSQVIPDDTDNDPRWGELATLNVTVTDDTEVLSVTVNLSAIGGSAIRAMSNVAGDIWSVTTNASAGTPPQTYYLHVNATDIYGNSNTSVSIPLTVLKNGDVTGNGVLTIGDAMLLANHVSYPYHDPPYVISSPFAADVTGNGVLTIGDAMLLANHVSYPYHVPPYVLR